MAVVNCTASNLKQTLVNVPLHMKAKIDAVNIDNQGVGNNTVQLEDDFTQDISNGNNTPTARTAFPFQNTVPVGTSFSADYLSVKSIPMLGSIAVLCSALDAGVAIKITYHLE